MTSKDAELVTAAEVGLLLEPKRDAAVGPLDFSTQLTREGGQDVRRLQRWCHSQPD